MLHEAMNTQSSPERESWGSTERGDQAVGLLRRQLAEQRRATTYMGEPVTRVDLGAVSDLIDAYVALRRER